MNKFQELLSGKVKFKDGKKWKDRFCAINKLSEAADHLQLHLTKDKAEYCRLRQSSDCAKDLPYAGLVYGFEHGRHVDGVQNVIVFVCSDTVLLLAFDTFEVMNRWQELLHCHLIDVWYRVRLARALEGSKLIVNQNYYLHVQSTRIVLVCESATKLVWVWHYRNIKNYGIADGFFVLVGSTNSGKGRGTHFFSVDGRDKLDALHLDVHAYTCGSTPPSVISQRNIEDFDSSQLYSSRMTAALENGLKINNSVSVTPTSSNSISPPRTGGCTMHGNRSSIQNDDPEISYDLNNVSVADFITKNGILAGDSRISDFGIALRSSEIAIPQQRRCLGHLPPIPLKCSSASDNAADNEECLMFPQDGFHEESKVSCEKAATTGTNFLKNGPLPKLPLKKFDGSENDGNVMMYPMMYPMRSNYVVPRHHLIRDEKSNSSDIVSRSSDQQGFSSVSSRSEGLGHDYTDMKHMSDTSSDCCDYLTMFGDSNFECFSSFTANNNIVGSSGTLPLPKKKSMSDVEKSTGGGGFLFGRSNSVNIKPLRSNFLKNEPTSSNNVQSGNKLVRFFNSKKQRRNCHDDMSIRGSDVEIAHHDPLLDSGSLNSHLLQKSTAQSLGVDDNSTYSSAKVTHGVLSPIQEGHATAVQLRKNNMADANNTITLASVSATSTSTDHQLRTHESQRVNKVPCHEFDELSIESVIPVQPKSRQMRRSLSQEGHKVASPRAGQEYVLRQRIDNSGNAQEIDLADDVIRAEQLPNSAFVTPQAFQSHRRAYVNICPSRNSSTTGELPIVAHYSPETRKLMTSSWHNYQYQNHQAASSSPPRSHLNNSEHPYANLDMSKVPAVRNSFRLPAAPTLCSKQVDPNVNFCSMDFSHCSNSPHVPSDQNKFSTIVSSGAHSAPESAVSNKRIEYVLLDHSPAHCIPINTRVGAGSIASPHQPQHSPMVHSDPCSLENTTSSAAVNSSGHSGGGGGESGNMATSCGSRSSIHSGVKNNSTSSCSNYFEIDFQRVERLKQTTDEWRRQKATEERLAEEKANSASGGPTSVIRRSFRSIRSITQGRKQSETPSSATSTTSVS